MQTYTAMLRRLKGSSMNDPLPKQGYDELADEYARIVDTKPHNAFYDRPAVQSMISDVDKLSILDAGCGVGSYTEWLLDHGADVVGLDGNEKMLSHARQRCGDRANFVLANLEEPLGFFPDQSFDGIVSALTVTYVKDLELLFREFARILNDKGWLVFSTEHPFHSYGYFHIDNYFQTKEVECLWKGFGKPVSMKSYFRSLGSFTEALNAAGFAIELLKEPLPTEDFRRVDPDGYDKICKFPLFLCIRARKR